MQKLARAEPPTPPPGAQRPVSGDQIPELRGAEVWGRRTDHPEAEEVEVVDDVEEVPVGDGGKVRIVFRSLTSMTGPRQSYRLQGLYKPANWARSKRNRSPGPTTRILSGGGQKSF